MFGKRAADPIQASTPNQKPSPFGSSSFNFNNQNNQSSSSPSIFNNSTQNQNQNQNQSNPQLGSSTSNSLFGNLQNNNNLFAASSSSSSSSTAPTFGAQATAKNNLFSSSNSPTPFGLTSTSTSTPQQTSTALVTSQNQTLFGSSTTPNSNLGLFANRTDTHQSTPGFNHPTQTPSTPLNNSLFNSTNQSVFNRSASTNNINALSRLNSSTAQLYRRPITLSELSIQDRISKIHSSWNVADPQCQFHYFFYNVVPPDQVHLYGRPNQLAPDDPKWQRAKRNNPDPRRLVPTLAIGFEDLTKRVSVQQKQAQLHLAKLEEISNKLNEITRKHNLETSSRLHKLKTQQLKLSARLMGLVNKLNGIALHSSSSAAVLAYPPHLQTNYQQQQMLASSAKEQELIDRIKNLKAVLDRFGGKAKISELWSTLNQIKTFGGFYLTPSHAPTTGALSISSGTSHSPLGSTSHGISNNHNALVGGFVGVLSADSGAGKWSVTDEREIKKVLDILVKQQKGIDHLILILRKARADVTLMRQAFNLESNLKSVEW